MNYEKCQGEIQSKLRITVKWASTDQCQPASEQDQDNLFLSQVIYRYLITVILTVKLWCEQESADILSAGACLYTVYCALIEQMFGNHLL